MDDLGLTPERFRLAQALQAAQDKGGLAGRKKLEKELTTGPRLNRRDAEWVIAKEQGEAAARLGETAVENLVLGPALGWGLMRLAPAAGRAIAQAQPNLTPPKGNLRRGQVGAIAPLERVDPQRGFLADRMRVSVDPQYTPQQVELATRSLELPSGQLVTATDPGRGFTPQAAQALTQRGEVRGAAGGILDMPTFYKLAPDAKDVRVELRVDPKQPSEGAWEFGKGLITGSGRTVDIGPHSASGVASHEMAHVAQDIFGFPRGGNVKDSRERLLQLQKELIKRMDATRQGSAQQKEILRRLDNIDSWLARDEAAMRELGVSPYIHLQGEALARAVQNLHKLPPGERAAAPLRYDVPRHGLLTRPEDVMTVAAPR